MIVIMIWCLAHVTLHAQGPGSKKSVRYVTSNEDSSCFEIHNKEEDSPTEYSKAVQDKQSKVLVEIIKKYRNNHEETLEWMRAEVTRLRDNWERRQ